MIIFDVNYPGVDAVVNARYTRSLGVLPGVCRMAIHPQPNSPDPCGNLTFTFGADVYVITDCLLDEGSILVDDNGQIVHIQILDRRWKWRYSEITGHYNRTLKNGDVVGPQKNDQELVGLLLDALGETGYDHSVVPTTFSHERLWECANASTELELLLDDLGLALAMKLNGDVEIVRPAVTGTPAPIDGDVRTLEYGKDYPRRPDSIRVCCGETLYESKLRLEAVGLDTDGEVKTLDDLSYKPATGWEKEQPGEFANVTTEEGRNLARRTVWRWYRVATPIDVPCIDTADAITLKPHKIATYDLAANKHQDPARIEGEFLKPGNPPPLFNTDIGVAWTDGFRIVDPQAMIVELEAPAVFKTGFGTNTINQPAKIYLWTSFYARDDDDGAHIRYTRDRNLVGPGETPKGTGPFVVHKPEYRSTCKFNYEPGNVSPVGETETVPEIEIDAYLDDLVLTYTSYASRDIEYNGIKNIDVDGIVRQVVWWMDMEHGAFTRVGENMEVDVFIPQWPERKRKLRQKKLVEEYAKNNKKIQEANSEV